VTIVNWTELSLNRRRPGITTLKVINMLIDFKHERVI
jgi:hypothetical protein